MSALLTTGQVARLLSERLGYSLTERQINAVVRRRPAVSPPIISGRRLWGDVHVAALAAELAGRLPRSA